MITDSFLYETLGARSAQSVPNTGTQAINEIWFPNGARAAGAI
jgi:hypothetical protein